MKRRVRLLALLSASFACAATGSQPAAPALENTHWTLASLGPARTPIAATQSEPFIVLGADPPRVSGSGGCNRLAGGYERNGEAITFGALAATRMACAQGMEVEDALGKALAAAARWRIAGGALELYDAAGALLASFSAKT